MKLFPLLLCSVMFGQEPRVQPQDRGSYLECRSDGTYSFAGWQAWNVALGDAMVPLIVRDWPGFITGDCSKWKEKTVPALEPKPCHLAIIWPFDDQREESAMKVRICSTEEK